LIKDRRCPSSHRFAWLNTIIAVASGVRTRNLVELEAFELR